MSEQLEKRIDTIEVVVTNLLSIAVRTNMMSVEYYNNLHELLREARKENE